MLQSKGNLQKIHNKTAMLQYELLHMGKSCLLHLKQKYSDYLKTSIIVV